MKIKKILLSMLLVLGIGSFSGVANAACGKITIAKYELGICWSYG